MNILEEIQNCPVEWKELGDKNVSKLSRGKVMSKQFLEENKGEFPVYSSQTANNGEIGRISSFEYDGEYITWTTDGANAGTVFYRRGKFSITNVCGLVEINNDQLLTKFVYYYLTISTKKYVSSGMGNPKLMSNVMGKIKIPIPPLEIQEKIVQILDKFTDYVTELTSELTSRKKQYSFYRDKLLSFENEFYQVEWKTIQDISVKIVTGVTPKKSCEDYYLKGTIPWLRTNEVKFNTITTTEKYVTEKAVEETGLKWILPNSIIIAISGATAGRVAMNSIPLTTNQHCCSISVDERMVNYKYLYYWLVDQNRQILSLKQGARGDINMSMIKSFKIPVPSLEIQSRIVRVLDNFDTVCNDLNIGLPKEIELRQKQYEYFREKLLTFVAEGEYTESRVE